MAQDGPKMAHIHEIFDSHTFLPPQVSETSFFTTQIEGAIFYGRVRRLAANCGESRRAGGVGPLNTTNTFQTGKEHFNTHQRA